MLKNKWPEWVSVFLQRNPEWRDDIDLLLCPLSHAECISEHPELDGSDAIKPLLTSFGVSRRALYFRLRRLGQTHRFAEMVACQSGPVLNTDSTFFHGMPMLGDQFVDERQKTAILRKACQRGYVPSAGDVYQSGLARFQGDPEAFVGPSQGRGYIRRLCEKRGWACEGAVNTPYREPLVDPLESEIPLAEDLIQSNARMAVQKNPELAGLSRQELRGQIVKQHGPSDIKGIETKGD